MTRVRGGAQLVLLRHGRGMMFDAVDIAPHMLLLMFAFPLTFSLRHHLHLSLSSHLAFLLALLFFLLLLIQLKHMLLDGQPLWKVKRRLSSMVQARDWSGACRLWMTLRNLWVTERRGLACLLRTSIPNRRNS